MKREHENIKEFNNGKTDISKELKSNVIEIKEV